jgi:glutamyl-tRNA reductase
VQVILLGVSHRTAPVELRERLDFSSRDLGAAIEALALRPSAAETVVLSTCNRSEIYVVSGDPARAREEVTGFLSEYHSLPVSPHLRRWRSMPSTLRATRVPRSLGIAQKIAFAALPTHTDIQ